jgi:hypothetical protein
MAPATNPAPADGASGKFGEPINTLPPIRYDEGAEDHAAREA